MRTYSKWLPALFFVTLAFSVAVFISTVLSAPHGGWDAWAIWNLKAKFLANGHFRDIFDQNLWWSHPDYPLLLPGLIALIWRLTGTQSLVVPALVAGGFTFGTVALLVWAFKGWRGWLAGTILLSCGGFVLQGASEYADVPLGFLVLGCAVYSRRIECSIVRSQL